MAIPFYPAVSGVLVSENEFDMASANAGNMHTPGFKSSVYSIKSMPKHTILRTDGYGSEEIGKGSDGIYNDEIVTDFSQGELIESTRSLDFAINDGRGDTFLSVADKGSRIVLSRAGNCHLDNEGYLTHPSGRRVLGTDGAEIFLGTDQVTLDEDGTLTDKDDQVLGEIGLWSPGKGVKLERTDDNCFIAKTAELVQLPSEETELHQYMLEESNVDTTTNTLSLAKSSQGSAYYTNILKATKRQDEKSDEIISQK
ncbi:flagellar basal-body rod protein FlgF [Clostridia bacterium]|nr:flagellar basal-body rod protein FlgF [Clostridia bacterium]